MVEGVQQGPVLVGTFFSCHHGSLKCHGTGNDPSPSNFVCWLHRCYGWGPALAL